MFLQKASLITEKDALIESTKYQHLQDYVSVFALCRHYFMQRKNFFPRHWYIYALDGILGLVVHLGYSVRMGSSLFLSSCL